MPTTRRSAGRPAASGSNKQQSTLSFNHRVTKPVPQSAKGATKNIIGTTTPAKQSPLGKHVLKVEDEEPVDVEAEEEEEEEQETKREAEEEKKSEAELRALKVTDRQIDQYWRGLERERTARRVHQRELSLAEKVLRYWDVSSQYGVSSILSCHVMLCLFLFYFPFPTHLVFPIPISIYAIPPLLFSFLPFCLDFT